MEIKCTEKKRMWVVGGTAKEEEKRIERERERKNSPGKGASSVEQ